MNRDYTQEEIKDFIQTAKTNKEIEALEFSLLALQNNEKHNSDFYAAWIESDYEEKHIENIWICFDRQIEIRIHVCEKQEDIYFVIYYNEGNKEGMIGLNQTEIFEAISDIQKTGLNYSFDVIQ